MHPNDRKILKKALASLPASRKASVSAALGVTAKARGDWDNTALSRAVDALIEQSSDLSRIVHHMDISSKSERALEAANDAILELAESLGQEFAFDVRY
jgi:hypothetical protein